MHGLYDIRSLLYLYSYVYMAYNYDNMCHVTLYWCNQRANFPVCIIISKGTKGIIIWSYGSNNFNLKPSLKKVVSGPAPGQYISAEWEILFHFGNFVFFWSKFHHFLTTKKNEKKNKILRPPDWPQYWPPSRLETEVFFKGGLKY